MSDCYVLGANLSHDSSAALLCNGDLVCAIAEERLSRRKHCHGGIDPDGAIHSLLPLLAINYCLDSVGIAVEAVDLIVVSSSVVVLKDFRTRNLTKQEILRQLPDSVAAERVVVVGHHAGHAASAFYPSGFADAAVIVADGGGSLVQKAEAWYEERTSIYWGRDGELDIVEQFFDKEPSNGFLANEAPCSLGDYYQSATEFIGFSPGEEGKTMGLAPYGSDKYYLDFTRALKYKGGNFSIDPEFQFNKRLDVANGYGGVFGRPHAAGAPQNELERDIAAAAQYALEEVLVGVADSAYDKTRTKNLCLAGGIALNSVANKVILDRTPFERIFIQPASGDDGCALGNALVGWRQIMGGRSNFVMTNAYTGRTYSEREVAAALGEYSAWVQVVQQGEGVLDEICHLLTRQKIIGWFQGGSEFGPRALGHRSILCDPRQPQMKNILNKRVKHREAFRPFAPSVLAEFVDEYFDVDVPSPYMLLVAKVKRPDAVPAITHVDLTGRVQTVTREANGVYYELIERFYALTGVPVLLNTSYNDNEEPIVETPSDAIRCFLKTNIDYLVIGDRLLAKKWLRCKTLRIWPNDLKRWGRRRAKRLAATSTLLAKGGRLARKILVSQDGKNIRIPG